MLVFYFGLLSIASSIAVPIDTCGPDYFPCNDGSCVEKSRWCDSKADCLDDSDEDYCFRRSGLIANPNRCNLTLFFLCDDGRCIPAIGRCDGYSSCDDNSDEENCEFTSFFPISANLLQLKEINESSTELNEINTVFANSYGHEHMMQNDHAHPTEATSIVYETYPTVKVETSDNTLILQHTDQVLASVPSNGNVSNNINNLEESSEVQVNHRKALEFGEILGMLNTSQNVSTTAEPENYQKSVPSNETSSMKIKDGNDELKSSLNTSKIQSKMSDHFIHNKNTSNRIKDEEDIIHNENTSNHIKDEEDIYKGYVELHARDFQKAKERALHWLVHSRGSDYGWDDETARAWIALRIENSSVGKTREDILSSKELHLKLFTLLYRNKTEINLEELALHINALSASCDNPRNFYGHDLVNILRRRTDAAQMLPEFVSPLVYLVLCLNNASSDVDVVKVRDMMYDSKINKTDSEALISLAATCLSRIPKFSSVKIGPRSAHKLYHKITSTGLPRNIYELALLTQALNEARVNQNLWNRTEAMRRIIHLQEKSGSFGDILSTYLTIPTLSGKSFLSIGKTCPKRDTDLVPLEVLSSDNDEKMSVYYSLRLGNPVEMAQTLTILVQVNTSFMDIMRKAAIINPAYEFKYDATEGKPIVYSIGGIANDAEKGLYWTPYTTTNSEKELQHFEGDIRNFSPAPGEDIVFWRKRIF